MASRTTTILNLRNWILECKAACRSHSKTASVAIDANSFHNMLTSFTLLLDDVELKEEALEELSGRIQALEQTTGEKKNAGATEPVGQGECAAGPTTADE